MLTVADHQALVMRDSADQSNMFYTTFAHHAFKRRLLIWSNLDQEARSCFAKEQSRIKFTKSSHIARRHCQVNFKTQQTRQRHLSRGHSQSTFGEIMAGTYQASANRLAKCQHTRACT